MPIRLAMGSFYTFGAGAAAAMLPKRYALETATVVSSRLPFSAQVATHYSPGGELAGFRVRFFCDGEPVYVRDTDMLGTERAHEGSVFRFFDWKDPIWTQIHGSIVRHARKRYGGVWYTHEFTFTIGEDVAGVDYFGLRLQKGMCSLPNEDNSVWVIRKGVEQQMVFNTPYFILNPKDALHDVIRIRQDTWMPLLVAAYTLGSAVERRGRPYFSQSIEKIQGWFQFVIGQRRSATVATLWDEAGAKKQLIAEMIKELWEKGPRRLVAFYSGMGYVFNMLGLADIAADVIHEFSAAAGGTVAAKGKDDTFDDISPRLFAVMLLLGLGTEKARLYVTVDFNDQYLQESHTKRGIRELLEIRGLMELFFKAAGQKYAKIAIPKPFELQWGQLEEQDDGSGVANLTVSYKDDMSLLVTFMPCESNGRYLISLLKVHAQGKQEWLGRILLSQDGKTGAIRFISESMTSSFRQLKDINAFKYILLVAAIQYTVGVLHANPEQIVFEAVFFDHCAPYDLMLLQHFGWRSVGYDIFDYNLSAAEVFPYSGRAMTLRGVRIPSKKKAKPALILYLLGPDGTTVAVDKTLYEAFVAKLHRWSNWDITIEKQAGILIDGVPYHMENKQAFYHSLENKFLGIDRRVAC